MRSALMSVAHVFTILVAVRSEAALRATARGRRRRRRIRGPAQLPSHRPPEARHFVDV